MSFPTQNLNERRGFCSRLSVNSYILEGGTKRTHVFEMGSTSERYVEMLRNFLRPQLRSLRVNMEEMWFQQDGATTHMARASMTVVRQLFPQHVVSRFGDVPWHAHQIYLPAISFFGVTSNQKSTFENLVQSI